MALVYPRIHKSGYYRVSTRLPSMITSRLQIYFAHFTLLMDRSSNYLANNSSMSLKIAVTTQLKTIIKNSFNDITTWPS